jgi:predicted amidophosphoribosyltransferase
MSKPINLRTARQERADRYLLVPCAHCGRDIPMHSRRCPRCGVRFSGEAFQFTYRPESEANSTRPGAARLLVALILCIAVAVTLAYLLLR